LQLSGHTDRFLLLQYYFCIEHGCAEKFVPITLLDMKSNQKTRTFVSFSNHGAKKRCSSPTLHEISIIYPNDKQEGFNSSVENSLLCCGKSLLRFHNRATLKLNSRKTYFYYDWNLIWIKGRIFMELFLILGGKYTVKPVLRGHLWENERNGLLIQVTS
jgi:hypothetical protein